MGDAILAVMVEGTIAARFELAERRGSGGMGQIYRAVDRVTGKSVALKVLRDASPAAAA